MKAISQNLRPSDGQSNIKNHPAASLILVAFILLAGVYSFVTPPFEAGDESRHYAVVKYMADTGRLPVQTRGEAQIHWSHEGNQPPLYYALAAALTFWIDTGTWADVYWYNPHASIGDPLRPDNKNMTIHPPGEAWPFELGLQPANEKLVTKLWRGHVLAVHLIRFLSIAMAAVTVIACYFIALNLFNGNRRLAAGAMTITAFNPMFIFISSSVNNDNAVIMFVTLALWLMVRMANGEWRISESANQRISEQQFGDAIRHSSFIIHHSPLLLGLLIGLGALSKLYALGLLPLAGLLFFWLAYQNDRRPETGDRRPSQASLQAHDRSEPNSTLAATAEQAEDQPLTPHASRLTSHVSRITSQALTRITTTSLVTLVVAGWFYIRNALLYGDPLALQVMREVAGQRHHSPTLATLWAEFEGFRIAYWALFGGVNVLVSPWIYKVLDVVSLIAVLGVIGFTIYDYSPRSRAKWDLRFTIYTLRPTPHAPRFSNLQSPISLPTFGLLLAWFLIMFAGFIVWNLTQPAGQGRLLYPAIAAISALGMLGLTWWLPPPGQKFIVSVCAFSLFAFATLSPILYIAPAYTKPPLLTQQDLPADLQPLDFTYDGKMRLLGYQLHPSTVHPAETLPLTLYWQMLEPVDLNYSIFIHLLARQRQVVGQIDTYPGGGHWPTTLLSPGTILADHYQVPILPEAELAQAPARLLISAGIYDYDEPGRPGKPAVNAAGEPVESLIASAKLIPWQWPNPARFDPTINFADKVTLLSYKVAADQKSVTLNWQVNTPLDLDYTVFLQVWSAEAKTEQVAGFDGPPVQGDYPTSLWASGEIIVDTHALDLSTLPGGEYYLLAGFYNPLTGERLPAATPNGPLPDYAVNLGTLRVTR